MQLSGGMLAWLSFWDEVQVAHGERVRSGPSVVGEQGCLNGSIAEKNRRSHVQICSF